MAEKERVENAFKKIKIRGQAPNSDHYWFSVKKVPSIFIYTMGGIKAYHDPVRLALNEVIGAYAIVVISNENPCWLNNIF